jgi:uncharacterized protein YndB with AHSA1/START domain
VQLDGGPARRTVLARSFPTDRADLWDAVTSAERIPRWFLPITGDLRVGGRYQLEGHAGGIVERCEPPSRFRVTWGMGEGMVSWVTVTLEPDGAGTRLELEHLGQVPDELWSQFGPSATGLGWDLMLFGLGLHVETGAANDPAEAAAWMASPDDLAFMQESAQAWQAADEADGAPAEEAAARAQRTIAAYTGQSEPPPGEAPQ